jgi:hypothetical protein
MLHEEEKRASESNLVLLCARHFVLDISDLIQNTHLLCWHITALHNNIRNMSAYREECVAEARKFLNKIVIRNMSWFGWGSAPADRAKAEQSTQLGAQQNGVLGTGSGELDEEFR